MGRARNVIHLSSEQELGALPSKPGSSIHSGGFSPHLKEFVRLVANSTESYSCVVFFPTSDSSSLRLVAHHSLSRDFLPGVTVGYGQGLVGWVAQNKTRILVCPFDNDSRTLMYYSRDQALKSFIALPLLSQSGELLGVMACDSKKNYGFAKLVEKVLASFAEQIVLLLGLYSRLQSSKRDEGFRAKRGTLDLTLDSLRNCETERELLSRAADLPRDLVDREALVLLSGPLAELPSANSPSGGSGGGEYYAAGERGRAEKKLLDMVWRYRGFASSGSSPRRINAGSERGNMGASASAFLSVPFRVLDREAGSFNLLGRGDRSFAPSEISALEKVAALVGRELERFRLRELYTSSRETVDFLSWQSFASQAGRIFGGQRAGKLKAFSGAVTLIRLSLSNIDELELAAGPSVAAALLQRVMRLVDQVKPSSALACYLRGAHILLLMGSADVDRTFARFDRLLRYLGFAEGYNRQSSLLPEGELRDMILGGLRLSSARFPKDGATLDELCARTLRDVRSAPSLMGAK